MTKEQFNQQRNDLIDQAKSFLDAYNNFTKDVSPQHWRISGHYYVEINRMISDLPTFELITDEQKEIYRKYIM
jgi:hypothetical protein